MSESGTTWVLQVFHRVPGFHKVRDTLGLISVTRQGLPASCLVILEEHGASGHDIDWVVGSRRTRARRQANQDAKLNVNESERAVRLARVMGYADHVFVENSKAQHWLNRPNPALGGQRPLDLARSESGARLVETALNRIAYGDYS